MVFFKLQCSDTGWSLLWILTKEVSVAVSSECHTLCPPNMMWPNPKAAPTEGLSPPATGLAD